MKFSNIKNGSFASYLHKHIISMTNTTTTTTTVNITLKTGILFVHWIADSLTLWRTSVSDRDVWTAASYYALFARARAEQGYLLAALVTLGAATILWSFGDGAAENLMFDGASICEHLFASSFVPLAMCRGWMGVYFYMCPLSFDCVFSFRLVMFS